MCHYITATVPRNSDREALRALFARHGRGFEPVANPHVQAQLPPGSVYLCTTSAMCDCGTSLGARRRKEGTGPEAQIPKLRAKGWSQAKIRRWLSEKERADEKREREREALGHASRGDAASWCDLIAAVLECRAADRVGLLLHWYSGSPATERMHLAATERAPLVDLSPELLMEIQEDVLYQFAA